MKTTQRFLSTLLMAIVRLCAPQMFRLSSPKVFMMVMCLAMLCVGTGAAQTQSVSLCFEDGELSQECFEIENGGQVLKEFAKGSYKYFVLYEDDVNVWYLSSEIKRENASNIELYHYESIYDAQTFEADVFGDYTFTVSWDENLKFTLSVTYPPLPALTTGENKVNIGEGETATYSFTPTESGYYYFYSKGNGVDLELSGIMLGEEEITIFGKADFDDYNKNFDNIVALTADNTYTVSIKCLSGTADNYIVKIEKKDYPVFTYTATSDMSASFNNDFDTYCGTWKDGSTPVTVIVKEKVEKIEEGKFNDCKALTSIILPSGLEYIYESFNGCSNLASITLPSSLAEIHDSFKNCGNLASISCPSSLTEIYYSFDDCYNLNNVHLSSIPRIEECDIYAEVAINLTDNSYVAEDMGRYPVYSGITYTREMSNQWGTAVLPFALNYHANNSNYKLYHLTKATDEALTFTEYNDEDWIDPGTPMVIKALDNTWDTDLGKYVVTIEETTYGLGTEINATDDVDGLSMKGTFKETTIGGTEGNGVYFIANNEFYRADAKTTVKPFRAWFEGTIANGGSSANLRIEVADETEGITIVSSEEVGVRSWFDLMGRKTNTRSGLLIENDRVVFLR